MDNFILVISCWIDKNSWPSISFERSTSVTGIKVFRSVLDCVFGLLRTVTEILIESFVALSIL
jgi:hypothetical protein